MLKAVLFFSDVTQTTTTDDEGNIETDTDYEFNFGKLCASLVVLVAAGGIGVIVGQR